MDLGLGMVGAVAQVHLLSKTGKNNLTTKGAFFGITYGAVITAILSGFNTNKVKPKDARSNLSYLINLLKPFSRLPAKSHTQKHT